MKQVILIRHAKSDWDNPALDDFDRPLNERGKKDAPRMAQRLKDRMIRIDAFIASPAKRAAKTAKIFAEAYNRKKEDILFKKELYMAGPFTFLETIENADDQFQSIAVFSHNNGITEFANLLTNARIDNIPTCGIFAVKADCAQWKDFKDAAKEFLFFDYPKAGE
ncbi:MAG: histidine phosphatase family protein [Bacteroidetes bacterium]|nr:histidine phosphatase family protein [Bacteroidota bacterium]